MLVAALSINDKKYRKKNDFWCGWFNKQIEQASCKRAAWVHVFYTLKNEMESQKKKRKKNRETRIEMIFILFVFFQERAVNIMLSWFLFSIQCALVLLIRPNKVYFTDVSQKWGAEREKMLNDFRSIYDMFDAHMHVVH